MKKLRLWPPLAIDYASTHRPDSVFLPLTETLTMLHQSRFPKLTGALILAVAAGVCPAIAKAADADAPTRIIVGFAPGGSLDILARTFAEKMRPSLGGAPVVVENKPGASARIALESVKNSAPDGKTILISSPSPIVIFPYTYKNLRYDPEKDLLPVAHLADVPLAASVSVNRPYKTLPDYVAWVKQRSDSVGVGLVALGSPSHFGLMSFGKSIGVPLTPVPYRGVAPMLTDIIGDVLPMGIDAIGGQMPLYKAGKVRFLAVTGTKRSALLPDVPTFAELGVSGFELASSWFAAFVPAGTPPAAVARLEKAFLDAAKDPAVKDKLAALGIEVTGRAASPLHQGILDERAHWQRVVKASGFTAND